jgi:hypothetical protein
MAQTNFSPTPNVSTHADATAVINDNANDAESRLVSIEAKFTQQTITSSSGILGLNTDDGNHAIVTLTENISDFAISNASAGDNGLIVVRQDGTGGWTFATSHEVAGGFISDISTVTINSVGYITISWYFDGSNYYLFISEPK